MSGVSFLKSCRSSGCFSVNVVKFLRIAVLKNICKLLLLLYLTDFPEQLVFKKLFFRTAYLTYFFSNFDFPFVSLDIFISFNNFIIYTDGQNILISKYQGKVSCINVRCMFSAIQSRF